MIPEKQTDIIYNTIEDVIFTIEVEDETRFKFSSVNNAFLNSTGLAKKQVINKYVEEVIPLESVSLVLSKYHEAIKTGSPVSWEEVSVYPKGERVGRVTAIPIFGSNKKCIQIVGSVHDVTEQRQQEKKMQEANKELSEVNEKLNESLKQLNKSQIELNKLNIELADSELRFRFLLQRAPVAIAILSGRDFKIEIANEIMLRTWNRSSEIIGMKLKQALPDYSDQHLLKALRKVYIKGHPYFGNEILLRLKYDGEFVEKYFNFICHPITTAEDKNRAIMVVANDVTNFVLARKEKEKAEELLRFAIEAANIGTWLIDENENFFPSARAKEIFGFNPNDEVTFEQALALISDEYRGDVIAAIERSRVNGSLRDLEYTINGFHDRKIRWIRAVGTAGHDKKGNIKYLTGVVFDISEQKEDEKRKNNFIGMVSHELKTPITTLSAYLQLLYGEASKMDDKFCMNAVTKAENQVYKMTAMINGFLNISRLESGKIVLNKHPFNLNELVADVIAESQQMIKTHKINFLPCKNITVNADKEKIESVIQNILSNALKYSKAGQTITVDCRKTGKWAEVSIQDEGIGIKEKDIAHIFDRYYRVESKATESISGFGIGLYLSAEIINRHDGKVWAESKLGKGSTFYFTLPLNK
jgi:PAS domain S-box-containing protein